MRITAVRPVLLCGPSTNDRFLAFSKRYRSVALVEVRSDTGLTGLGETYVGYFAPELVPPVVDYVAPILLNADSVDVPTLCQRMRRCLAFAGRVGAVKAVLAGVEAALWDLAGKAAGVPVCELLGGRRHDRLFAYATGGPAPWPLEELGAKVERYLSLGFNALKVSTGYLDFRSGKEVCLDTALEAVAQVEVDKLAFIRRVAGTDVALMLDGHMGHTFSTRRWDVATAKTVLSSLEPFQLMFFEEPLPYDDPEDYAALRRECAVAVAGGEQLSSADEFRLWMSRGAFDVPQPDASWLGLSDFLAVGKLAEAQGIGIASHSWSAGVGVMQNIHAAFASASTVVVEIPPDAGELHTALWGDSLVLKDGYVLPPAAPGLGVSLPNGIEEKFPFRPGMEEFSGVPGKLLDS